MLEILVLGAGQSAVPQPLQPEQPEAYTTVTSSIEISTNKSSSSRTFSSITHGTFGTLPHLSAELHEQLFSNTLYGQLEPPPPVRQVIHTLFPQTYPALDEDSLGALSAQLQAAGADCDQLLNAAVTAVRSEPSPLSQVRTALDMASLELLQQTGPRFRSVDVLSGRLDSLGQVNDLIPVVHPYFRLINTSTTGRTDWALVFKEANHNIRRLAVTPLVAQVLDLCSEPITVAELAARVGTSEGTSGSRLLEILQRLYADRVIIFNRRLA